MKARIGRTTFDNLPSGIREAAVQVAKQITEDKWQEVQQEVSTRFMLTMALALHDVFGFGTDRIERVMNVMSEIAVGYSDESYTPSEKRSGLEDMRRMTLAMAGELEKRGIRFKIE